MLSSICSAVRLVEVILAGGSHSKGGCFRRGLSYERGLPPRGLSYERGLPPRGLSYERGRPKKYFPPKGVCGMVPGPLGKHVLN